MSGLPKLTDYQEKALHKYKSSWWMKPLPLEHHEWKEIERLRDIVWPYDNHGIPLAYLQPSY